ncbi:hypothetical protein [Paludibaculum fermentans]|uniref:hypothetical protein n=1 Tax=Paludibaculum fermentans TaxID=1473598 RepID=UPI003EBD0B7F
MKDTQSNLKFTSVLEGGMLGTDAQQAVAAFEEYRRRAHYEDSWIETKPIEDVRAAMYASEPHVRSCLVKYLGHVCLNDFGFPLWDAVGALASVSEDGEAKEMVRKVIRKLKRKHGDAETVRLLQQSMSGGRRRKLG